MQTAQEAVRQAKAMLSLLGFLSWFLTVQDELRLGLLAEELDVIRSFCLGDRKKTGVVYNLKKNYHKITFAHLLSHNVPIHYLWISAERDDGRFRRLSPGFWNKYATLHEAKGEGDVDLKSLPSFEAWHEDLEGFDWYFQSLRAGKVGNRVTIFKLFWEYRLISDSTAGMSCRTKQ
ncbi:hypothetical protein B0H17DRAFT_1198692 [Mycena rosella]|uniref:Uncharacterized protein n=1 Tax=Mycena rosella TaxID=1033263 RepID=A0AAD7DQ13_MYCRO|nr:hypothetical protein B0H17DRAFT_1198692 [Mycena rosella]